MSLVEDLIDEVEKRPMLWNKYHDDHPNRTAVDREWSLVAKVLHTEKYKVKSKWRNLRDQFLREAKKLDIPSSGTNGKPLISFYGGKWMYFERLLFMKVIIDDHVRKKIYTNTEDTTLDGPEQIKLEEISVSDNSLSPEYYNDYIDTYPHIYGTQREEVKIDPANQAELAVSSRGKIVAKKRRLSNVEDDREEVNLDDDMHFVKSLVPFMKKLNPVRKLIIRSEIQNLLLRELTLENK
ncbi:uncharacterized protein LOC131845736 [Achroia grisella]|uniref:uncharacterized protein LOC131845736 n=1 Tax=Achroia grisella TaxID=688607 RepID=UPI0027D2FD33|nr:uncharacterized protein LOC131845736 [Achroia grisella]